MKKVFKVLVIILNALAAIALLISSTAGLVSPSANIFVSLASYGYLFLLFVNILFAAFWLCLRSKWCILSLAVILLRFNLIHRYIQLGGTEDVETVSEDDIKLLSFNVNIFKWSDSASLNTLDIIRSEKPDIICFQEFFANLPYPILDTMEAQDYSEMHHFMNTSKGVYGCTTFSRNKMIKKDKVDGTRAIFTDIVKGSDTIRVYNVHLDSYHLDATDEAEIDKMSHGKVDTITSRRTMRKFKTTLIKHEKEVALLEKSIEQCPYPSILCGDFNDPPASYAYDRLIKHYSDAFCKKGHGFGSTYNGNFPAFRIDYILFDKHFKALSYKRIKSDISDHYPIIATMQNTKR
ncbi:MAG: endonuclease/exonuclease/phosphatase family protein [Bacteroidales bacterium]|nr:endonuclease/exonuclease/phosphatase family protein [Bacteroidales bacterium]